ncbi:MAG: hypothetical protein JWN22_3897 [Nocardioides sp.]|jgi:hypothetical protein|nr:hypothetical protein [Nocardioides sp.]
MITFDRCRRAACVVLVVAFLVMVPSMATAKFTSSKAPTLSVSTATMEVATVVHGSFTCSSPSSNEAISLSITSFTDAGPAGATYTYTLLRGSVVKSTGTSTTHAKTLTGSQADDGGSTTWSMTIRAGLASWTGPVYTKTVTCNRLSNTTGTF